jgi:acetyl/propionyl-CoA carboxylase alpha subunit
VELHLKHGGAREVLRVAGAGQDLKVDRDGGGSLEARLLGANADTLWFEFGGERHRARYFRDGRTLFLHLAGKALRLELEDPDDESVQSGTEASPDVRSPMPGRILEVLTSEGATVSAGDALIRMEAMKMEIDLSAPCDGVVASIPVAAGDLVEPDAELVRIEPAQGS